jgi:hypothetical protein
LIYTFVTEDGVFDLEYSEFLNNEELMNRFGDTENPDRVFLNLGKTVISIDKQWLSEHPTDRKMVEFFSKDLKANPLKYFMPCCASRKDFNAPSLDFINTGDRRFRAHVAPNRVGKTHLAIVALLVNTGAFPMDKDWPIFKDHGVRYMPFTGPKRLAIMSYEFANFEDTILPLLKRIIPREQITDEAWRIKSPKHNSTFRLKDGTIIKMIAMSQSQGVVESAVYHAVLWDEQGLEHMFDGMEARLKTTARLREVAGKMVYAGGIHIGAFTPHKLKDRPDTGADGWMFKLFHPKSKADTKGFDPPPVFIEGTIADTPHWIYPEQAKKQGLDHLDNLKKAYKQGKATIAEVNAQSSRMLGTWEVGGSGVFAHDFDPNIHVIDDFEIPANWTLRRGFDHGRTNPSAMVCGYTSPQGFLFIGQSELIVGPIGKCVKHFAEKCGNTLRRRGKVTSGNHVIQRFVEEKEALSSCDDRLDCRTFKVTDDDTEFTKGKLWQVAGFTKMVPAARNNPEDRADIIRELLTVDPNIKNPITGEMGSPKVFFFRHGASGLIGNMQRLRNKEVTKNGVRTEKIVAKDDHDVDAFGFIVSGDFRFRAARPCRPDDVDKPKIIKRKPQRLRDPFTGERL